LDACIDSILLLAASQSMLLHALIRRFFVSLCYFILFYLFIYLFLFLLSSPLTLSNCLSCTRALLPFVFPFKKCKNVVKRRGNCDGCGGSAKLLSASKTVCCIPLGARDSGFLRAARCWKLFPTNPIWMYEDYSSLTAYVQVVL